MLPPTNASLMVVDGIDDFFIMLHKGYSYICIKRPGNNGVSERKSSRDGFVSGSYGTKCYKVIFSSITVNGLHSHLQANYLLVWQMFMPPWLSRKVTQGASTNPAPKSFKSPHQTLSLFWSFVRQHPKAHDGPRSSDPGSPCCLVSAVGEYLSGHKDDRSLFLAAPKGQFLLRRLLLAIIGSKLVPDLQVLLVYLLTTVSNHCSQRRASPSPTVFLFAYVESRKRQVYYAVLREGRRNDRGP